ncbi:MAG TPA: hypothetical protein VF832_14845 [Longimicrobiales bacterium]
MRRLALALALALAACKEATGFVAVDRPPAPPADSARLTWSLGDDRAPTWRGADTVVYAAPGFEGVPAWQSLLVAQVRTGSVVRFVLPSLVSPLISRWLTTPSIGSAGAGANRVAYVALDELAGEKLCPRTNVLVPPRDTAAAPDPLLPPLVTGRVILRGIDATTLESLDPQYTLAFLGPVKKTAAEMPLPGVPDNIPRYLTRALPFQAWFGSGGPLAFRPSWSPDGRVAFSDGVRLFTWSPPAAPVPVPGGDNLISAAWSPRGDLIAAAKPVIKDSALTRYDYRALGGELACAELRITYNVSSQQLTLITPAGVARDLGEGGEPAWAPDASAVYVTRSDGSIWRVPVDGSAAGRVNGSSGGLEPAVSPDGKFLAFTRLTAAGNHDVYVVRIAQ